MIYKIQESTLVALADAIREQVGNRGLTVGQMAEVIRQQLRYPNGTLEIDEAGSYDVSDYAQARVSIGASAEGTLSYHWNPATRTLEMEDSEPIQYVEETVYPDEGDEGDPGDEPGDEPWEDVELPDDPIHESDPSYAVLNVDGGEEVTVYFMQSAPRAVTLYWGDGSDPETYEGEEVEVPFEHPAADGWYSSRKWYAVAASHSYDAAGSYTLALICPFEDFWTPGATFVEAAGGALRADHYGFLGAFSDPDTDDYPALASLSFGSGGMLCAESWYAFCGCSQLRGFVIPDGTDVIPKYAFCGCAALAVNLELNVQEIREAAFYGCSSIRKVWVRQTCTSIAGSSGVPPFQGCSAQCTLYAESDTDEEGWENGYDVYDSQASSALTVVYSQNTKPW